MYHATFLYCDDTPAPTAKEIQNYFKKSTRLLYGNDKRKSKSTPMRDSIHVVTHSFDTFSVALTGRDYISTMLYIFDDKANSLMLGLRYANQVICRFKLDEQVVDEIWNVTWSYEQLRRFKREAQSAIDDTIRFANKSVGSKAFHRKAVPPFVKATQTFISEVEQEMTALELEAKRLFNSDWN